ncbi:MAG: T9SS type A sorting domain-containing protein [Melioribacteraceae bacterium]|nr:T9SS type A sorting domain-containing protein [Melioribacteraceae bacterium]MCF8356398.1 T9SS type A sorting domain-containing protein [Melioribacteraceae bacterium]MCF8392258.1 T9SS type A sorting domain-containing protein [Melioribacteraceae bacterium]MCF8417590.1 T9SS type A sorting domain-containing protein [Melioribacteraceae bacterium]
MRNILLLLSAVVLLFAFTINAQNISLTSAETKVEVLSNFTEELILEYDLSELVPVTIDTKRGEFIQLILPGSQYSNNVGEPKLPMMNRFIEIPIGADVRTEVIEYKIEEIDLNELGFSNQIIPVQPPLSKSDDPSLKPFEIDESIYSSNQFYKLDKISFDELGIMRYKNIGLLKVAPIEYNPVTNVIRIYNQLKIRVVFENSDLAATQSLKQKYYSPFFEKNFTTLLNNSDDGDPASLLRFPHKYIIITPSEFVETLQPFVDWKTQMGYLVVLKTTEELGSSNTGYKNFIHDEFNNATEDNPAPSFVLLVGDDDEVQPFSGETGYHVTDLPFVAVTSDYLPDIYTGRFSATNTSQLQAIIDKTLYYEKFEIEDPSYLNRITLIAGWDYSHSSSHGYPTIRYGAEQYFNTSNGYDYVAMYETTGSGQFESDIIQDVNDGVGFVNYTAHGSQTVWADPSFTISDVNNLTNSGKYTLAIGNACLTSAFDTDVCFGEAFTRAADKGAVGYIGGTNSTYWDEDVWWSTGYFAHVGDGVTPTFEETTLGAYDVPVYTDLTSLSSMVFAGNFAVMQSSSSLINYYWEIYELFGDPSLQLFWTSPEELAVNHLPILPVGSSSFEVSVSEVSNALVGVMMNGELLGSALTDEYGNANVAFDSPINEVGTVSLTVTAQNSQPYLADVQVIVPANVTLDPDTIAINTNTDVTVTVLDTAMAPISAVNIWFEAPGYFVDTLDTDDNGIISAGLNPNVGPYLLVKGQREGDSYLLFTDTVWVEGGTEFTDAELFVSTDFGISDTFSVNQPGVINGTAVDEEITVYAAVNNETVSTANSDTYELVPNVLGSVNAYLVKDGYNFYHEQFPIIVAKGVLAGLVMDGDGGYVSGARVKGFRNGEEVYSVTTGSGGAFAVPKEIEVGDIEISVQAFGFEEYSENYFMNYGSNSMLVNLSPAASSTISGTVVNEGGNPLSATVKFYRSDNGELYETIITDESTGSFSQTILNFEFLVKVKSPGYMQVDTLVNIHSDTSFAFTLEIPHGLLVIDADGGKRFTDKEGLNPFEFVTKSKSSAQAICDTFLNMGMTVTVEDIAITDVSTWLNYSSVIFCMGSDEGGVSTEMQTELLNHVQNDGVLIIEGGEIGYDHQSGAFAEDVLHINDWDADNSGDITVKSKRHPLASIPNRLPDLIGHSYSDYGDQDAVVPINPDEVVLSWTDYPEAGSMIAYDRQVVFMSFNFDKISDGLHKRMILENIADYLSLYEPLVSVNGKGENQIIPTDFELSQNYPNPFNPSSKIRFALPSQSNVKLVIFNSLGQQVAQLINNVMDAGYHETVWNAHHMATGVYFFRIEAESIDGGRSFNEVKKMLLLK